jgi:hypothetical protein
MSAFSKHVRLATSALVMVAAVSCGDEPKPATAIMSTTSLNQTAVVGKTVFLAPAVKVTNIDGGGVGGVTVTFAVASGAGTLGATSVTTADDGTASVGSWQLGTVAGANSITATAAGLTGSPLTFTATGTPDVPAKMTLVTGNAQTATVSTAVAVKPTVLVADQFDNPVVGTVVAFAVTGGGGAVTGASATTNAAGMATVGSWTLGASPGANSLSATAVGVATPINFSATGQASTAPITVTLNAGNKQAAMVGTAVAIPPSVSVTSNGAPMPGVTVTFAAGSGAGSVTGATATTDANGIATVGSWTMGSTLSLNTLTASVSGPTVTGSPVTFVASGCDGVGSGYRITLCFTADMTTAQKSAFISAAAKWETIITGDLSDVQLSATNLQAGVSCSGRAFGMPAGTIIDDLLIFATIEPIDGPGAVLGSASPCLIRNSNTLSIVGSMRFDVADMETFASQLDRIILHEMGHVLGIGSLWTQPAFNFLVNPSSTGNVLDTYYNGTNGRNGFNAIGGSTYTGGEKVPVENTGGPGTANAHWRENVLQNELMSGFLNNGTNPLSALTVGALQDLGYVVNNAAAESFSLTLSIMAGGGTSTVGGIMLKDDVFMGSLTVIDSKGRVTKIIR